jgi:hypothetical protein
MISENTTNKNFIRDKFKIFSENKIKSLISKYYENDEERKKNMKIIASIIISIDQYNVVEKNNDTEKKINKLVNEFEKLFNPHEIIKTNKKITNKRKIKINASGYKYFFSVFVDSLNNINEPLVIAKQIFENFENGDYFENFCLVIRDLINEDALSILHAKKLLELLGFKTLAQYNEETKLIEIGYESANDWFKTVGKKFFKQSGGKIITFNREIRENEKINIYNINEFLKILQEIIDYCNTHENEPMKYNINYYGTPNDIECAMKTIKGLIGIDKINIISSTSLIPSKGQKTAIKSFFDLLNESTNPEFKNELIKIEEQFKSEGVLFGGIDEKKLDEILNDLKCKVKNTFANVSIALYS